MYMQYRDIKKQDNIILRYALHKPLRHPILFSFCKKMRTGAGYDFQFIYPPLI